MSRPAEPDWHNYLAVRSPGNQELKELAAADRICKVVIEVGVEHVEVCAQLRYAVKPYVLQKSLAGSGCSPQVNRSRRDVSSRGSGALSLGQEAQIFRQQPSSATMPSKPTPHGSPDRSILPDGWKKLCARCRAMCCHLYHSHSETGA